MSRRTKEFHVNVLLFFIMDPHSFFWFPIALNSICKCLGFFLDTHILFLPTRFKENIICFNLSPFYAFLSLTQVLYLEDLTLILRFLCLFLVVCTIFLCINSLTPWNTYVYLIKKLCVWSQGKQGSSVASSKSLNHFTFHCLHLSLSVKWANLTYSENWNKKGPGEVFSQSYVDVSMKHSFQLHDIGRSSLGSYVVEFIKSYWAHMWRWESICFWPLLGGISTV